MILKLNMEDGEKLEEALGRAIEIAQKLDVKVFFIDKMGNDFFVDKDSSIEEKKNWYTKTVQKEYFNSFR